MARDTRLDHNIAGLDGLRAVAALAVFGVHFGQFTGVNLVAGPFELRSLLENGELGVALFFVLSGFLLSTPFWHAVRDGKPLPSFRAYALRRAARILPLYYLVLGVLIVLYGTWRYPGGWWDIALHAVFLFDFTEFSVQSINPPFWTLAVEMQFYLLLPILFVCLRRSGLRPSWAAIAWLALGCVAIYAIDYGSFQWFSRAVAWPFDPRLVWIRPGGAALTYSLPGHLPHFLIGVGAAAIAVMRPDRERSRPLLFEAGFWIAAAVVLVLAAAGSVNVLGVPHGRYGLPGVPLLIGLLVYAAPRATFARRVLEAFPLRPLGTISYGIYVFHYPCQFITAWQLHVHGIDAGSAWATFGAGSLAATIVLASLSYLLFERPIMRFVRRRTARA